MVCSHRYTGFASFKFVWTVGIACVAISSSAPAQTTLSEQSSLIKAPNAIAKIGSDLFGDSVNLYQGSLDFSQTDVTLRGNSALPVALQRRLVTGQQPYMQQSKLSLSNWQLDIPHLYGIFASGDGWKAFGNLGVSLSRCSDFSPPPPALFAGAGWDASEFWNGSYLHVPGGGDQQLLLRDPGYTKAPGPVTDYPVITARQWSFSCLASLDTGAGGEGFLAHAPDGTKYRFDHMVSYNLWSISKPLNAGGGMRASGAAVKQTAIDSSPVTTSSDASGASPQAADNAFLPRKEMRLLPTLVTDRFGNWVRYSYDPAQPQNLISISASDGRSLTLSYGMPSLPDVVTSVSDGTRTWTYSYSNGRLDAVVLPDASSWQMADIHVLQQKPASPGPSAGCGGRIPNGMYPISGTMTHPSGATGTFSLAVIEHGRSDVPQRCRNSGDGNQYAAIPNYIYTYSLTSKTISGPAMPAFSWQYVYGPANASWSPCGAGCAKSKTTTVTDPAGIVTRYSFGNQYRVSEGRLEQVDAGWNGSSAISTTTTRYRAAGAGPYPSLYGYGGESLSDAEALSRAMPVDQKITTQQGANFVWTANSFDDMARANSVTRASSLGTSRTETSVFDDRLPIWVLGNVATVTESSTGKVMVSNTYDATASLLTTSRFGAPVEQTIAYNADGTVASRADGKGQTTYYANYSAGLPQNTSYPTGASESASVRSNGYIDSMTDAVGATTRFGYDAMGRLDRISYPSGDPVAWNDTTISVEKVAGAEVGIALPHFRQTVSTGSGSTITYYDGLLRPVVTRSLDTATGVAVQGVLRKFDHDGKTTFESYAQPDIADIGAAYPGVTTTYDALGRPLVVSAASELGTLTTTNVYGAPFKVNTTDPRGNVSTTSLAAFDDPAQSFLASAALPEGVALSIGRDVFGKPLAVSRSGGGASATRSYVYDGFQRLCKTIEPETGATLQLLDAAGNLSWRAPGMALTSQSCDWGSVPESAKISFTYDQMNRLWTTNYGDNSATITRTYWADGQPQTVSSAGAVWTMNYNARRMPTSQSLNFEGQSYTLDTSYNANGHPLQLTYPAGTNSISARSVSFDPDALGRPTHVGNYAAGISYYANGAIAGFTYGNGKARAMEQNTRGLPRVAQDAGVLRDVYDYDQNGNVSAITDQFGAGPGGINTSRSMQYDGLDRLQTTMANGIWGSATYGYDALDNIRTSTIGGRMNTYHYGARNLLDNLQSTASGFTYNYAYDNRGNVTLRNGKQFAFDLGNRLLTADTETTITKAYIYDGFGRRVKSTASDGTVTISVYSPGGQLFYTRRSGGPNPAQSTQYIYLHNHQIAEVTK